MSNYYIVRTRNNVDQYVKQGVSAVGWSKINFTQYQEKIDALCEEVKKQCYNNNSSTLFVGAIPP